MKKVLLVIICLLLLSPLSTGHSAEKMKPIDAYAWQKCNFNEKLGFVLGWYEASVVIGLAVVRGHTVKEGTLVLKQLDK